MRRQQRSCLLVATAWLLACGSTEERFLTKPAVRGPIEATVSATGALNPVHLVEVGTYASGRVEVIDVDFNSIVTKGQRVAKIDPSTAIVLVQKARAKVQSTRARIDGAEADLRLKTEQLERQRALLEKTTVSKDHFESAETAYVRALAQLDIERASLAVSKAELEDANVNLAHTDIRSPVDGIVLSRNVNVGQTVAASFQTPTLFLIAQDLSKMQVDADVSEADIGHVEPGQLARFSVDTFPDRVFEGHVRQIRNSPISVQNVVTYDVVIDVDNRDLSLRPGMTATVTLVTAVRQDVLKVPRRALRFRPRTAEAARSNGAGGHLWVAGEDGNAEAIEIETGLRDEEFIEVTGDSLREGAEVIIGYRREE
jgi:HlyD family secretion protein